MSAAVLAVGVAAFVAWALDASPAETDAYLEATSDPHVAIVETRDGFITIRPVGVDSEVGLLFYPGLRVAPSAYVAKLAAVATAANVQIVIGRPPLNLAVLSINQADAMRAALPGVNRWYVGGHSLGGSMACVYASNHRDSLEGVVLLGTYCGTDISGSSLRVLSVTGDRDGLFPPTKIAETRRELPSGATIVKLPSKSDPVTTG